MKKEAKTAGKKKEEKAETAAEKSFTKTNLTRGEILEMLAEYHKDVHEFVEKDMEKIRSDVGTLERRLEGDPKGKTEKLRSGNRGRLTILENQVLMLQRNMRHWKRHTKRHDEWQGKATLWQVIIGITAVVALFT